MKEYHRIKIVSGHYGVGKSEFAANWAIKLANEGKKVALVDLDVVNPYFTTRGIRKFLEQKGVHVLGPSLKMTSADVPAIPSDVFSIFHDEDVQAIVDIGGDAPGAKVISSFYKSFEYSGYDFFYLINTNRPFTEDFEGALEFYEKIEKATRLKINHIVNSTHMLYETTKADILNGYTVASQVAEFKKLPLAFNIVPDYLRSKISQSDFESGEIFDLSITLRPDWLDYDKPVQ